MSACAKGLYVPGARAKSSAGLEKSEIDGCWIPSSGSGVFEAQRPNLECHPALCLAAYGKPTPDLNLSAHDEITVYGKQVILK